MRNVLIRPLLFAENSGDEARREDADVDAILHARDAARRGVRHAEEPLRIVLFDDQALTRQAMKTLLLQYRRLQCVLDVGTIEECLAVTTQQQAHVVILSLDAHHGDGLDDIRLLVQRGGGARVLAIGQNGEPPRLLATYRAGAAGYLATNSNVRDLHDAIEVVAGGGTYVDASTTKALASGLRTMAVDTTRNGALARLTQLSERERTVLRLVARGFSGPEIGGQLHITTKTVDTYRHRIHEKIGLRHRAEYVTLAIQAGVLID
jgi:DNA-binding NarL/FixJ family response regulator